MCEMKYSLIYIPCKNRMQARKIGETLVRAKLAACANIHGPMDSIYEWKGKLCREKETLLLVKTRKNLFKKIVTAVRKSHSYECPCICAFDISTGNADYLQWILTQTKQS